ncbi:MAG: hypothetical protein C0467_09170 [Planctomycetaceae bacterium]|nr:hypothetical protein [Planctomycetaceae bacterium]
MNSPIPLAVIYAGLAGTVLALIIATAQQKWSCKVFFLLALRLAIGWHFMFEGFHKIHSTYTGPTDTNRPFTSEPYFKVAPGPIGEKMRKQFGDPAVTIADKVKAPKDTKPEAFAKLSVEEQAAACPAAVIAQIDANDMKDKVEAAVKAEAAKELAAIEADEKKAIEAAKTDDDKAKIKAKADEVRSVVQKKDAEFKQVAAKRITEAKAAYARWVYGVDGRPSKVKIISTGDVSLTAPQRLEHIEWLRNEAKAVTDRQAVGLGNGYGMESKRGSEVRMDFIAAEADLAKDANGFIAELQKELNGGTAIEEPVQLSTGQKLDKFTMWFLVTVGAFIMGGFLTRLSCVMAAGFLVMTYLAHPAFPWYPLPPNTEGNPVFINKNIIECLALLALACMPTGRWLGIDAVIHRVICGKEETAPPATT